MATSRLLQAGKNLTKATSLEATSPDSSKLTQRLANADSGDDVAVAQTANKSSSDKKQKFQRPNAFISLRITNEQIIDRARQIQEEIIKHNPLLSKASVSIPTLHITLLVFSLNTDEEKQRAQQSLIEACHQMRVANIPSLEVSFNGLSHFNNKVLYIDPVKDAHYDALARMAGICRDAYGKNGIASVGNAEFQPHLTLFKLSKAPDLHRKGVRKIDPSWTTTYAGYHFGVQAVQSLHLCNMGKKQTDGYYEIFHEQSLASGAPDVSSTTEAAHAMNVAEKAVDDLNLKYP